MLKTGKKIFIVAMTMLLFMSGIGSVAAAEEPRTDTAAVDLRVALNRLLGEHVNLAIISMRKGIDGSADFEAAAGALMANAEDLSAAIASVYGEAAGDQFEKLWKDHIGYFVDYVTATANNDDAGKQEALDELSQYKQDFSTFLAGANPNLEAEALAEGLQMHVNQLIAAFNHYVDEDYEMANEKARMAYQHMLGTGAALSNAIVQQFPEKFNHTSTATAAAELRVALGGLLGEHAHLAITAMQDGISGSANFDAEAAVLLENADDLTAAIASVYGEAAGEQFDKLWKNHIGFFVDYVTATANDDEAGKQMALEELAQYKQDFSTFLAEANPNLKAEALAEGLQMHVNQLIGAFNHYVEAEYEITYNEYREAYAHMYATAGLLSAAIVNQFPENFQMEDHSTVSIALMLGSSSLKINDEAISMDEAPFIYKNRTFVSLRFVSEGLGANVHWDNAERTVTVQWADQTAVYWVGADYMELNGDRMEIGSKVFIRDGRTQIPVRFFAELMGWTVDWNGDEGSVHLMN